MEFKDAVNYRQSIRLFSDKKVAVEDIKEIVKTAQRAPSWVNAQPWKVYVATGETLEKIKENHLKSMLQGLPDDTDWRLPNRKSWDKNALNNMRNWSRRFRAHLSADPEEADYAASHLFNAPALVYLTLPKTASNWSIYDLGGFGQTLMLAAADKKIDSIPAYEIVKYTTALRKILNVPDDRIFGMGVALGYRADDNLIDTFRTKRIDEDKMLEIKK